MTTETIIKRGKVKVKGEEVVVIISMILMTSRGHTKVSTEVKVMAKVTHRTIITLAAVDIVIGHLRTVLATTEGAIRHMNLNTVTTANNNTRNNKQQPDHRHRRRSTSPG